MTQLKKTSFWSTTVGETSPINPLPLPARADVAIIGAGFTGLSAARTLARRGARVAVLESETVGWGASSRNGGMVLSGLKLPVTTLRDKYGLARSQQMYAASLASIDCVEKTVGEERIACDFARCGHLEVACKPAHFEDFRRSAEVLARDYSHEVRIVPHDGLQAEIGSEIYHGGLVDESSGGLNPAKYVAGLGKAAAKAGAELCEKARVESISAEASDSVNGYRLHTTRGALWARDVIVATSGYTGRATPALRKRVIPIGSYIIATEPLPEDLARRLSPRNRMIYDSKNFLYYYRLTPDRRMLFGGRAAFFPETPNSIARSAEILRRGMVSVYPALRDAHVEYAWGGTLDFTFDMLPHAGKLEGIHYAMGYAGHGVAMATYLGMKLAEAMCGDRDENPFAGLTFPRAPFGLYSGTPWFLPFAGAWYKILDWVQ